MRPRLTKKSATTAMPRSTPVFTGPCFHGQKRSNATHVSTTDPEARLYRKGQGKEAKLSYLGHTLDKRTVPA
jgi:hypothetical protein